MKVKSERSRPKRRPKRKAKRRPAVKIRIVDTASDKPGKYSGAAIAQMIRNLDNDWRAYAVDATKAVHELAALAGDGKTSIVDIRDRGIKTYWALQRRLDDLTGQLELFT